MILFTQIADGVDDRTWEYHRRAADYSRWFREIIKDHELSELAAAIEKNSDFNAAESRKQINEAVTQRYTAPSKPQT